MSKRSWLTASSPECPPDAEPKKQRAVGLQELGLPYAADPAITKHLAEFIHRNAEVLTKRSGRQKEKDKARRPSASRRRCCSTAASSRPTPLRRRLTEDPRPMGQGGGRQPVKELHGTDLDLAVARGAAYYGLVRRGHGVRIRGGTGQAYYVGIESSLPAVPGSPPPLKALCVVPFGMEEGHRDRRARPGVRPGRRRAGGVSLPRLQRPPRRRGRHAGRGMGRPDRGARRRWPRRWKPPAKKGRTVPVHLHSKVTEVGTLELWCLSRDGKQRWKLEFNVRERQGAG